MILAVLAAAAVFIAVSSLLVAVMGQSSGRTIERRLGNLRRTSNERPVESVLRTDSGTFPLLRRLATGTDWSERAARDLAQAGWTLKVSEYLLIRIVAAAAAGGITFLLASGGGLGLVMTIGLGVAGFEAPALVLAYYRSKRQQKINSQIAETLSLISNSLRSGFAFIQAVELAAKQIEPPMSTELQRLLRDISLGSPADVALQQLAERTGSYDLDMMVSTILIQRNTGGNLSEILDNVAETVRERERLQGEIRSLTASQRFTGRVLSLYPVALGLLFFALIPDVWSVLLEEEFGRVLLAAALVLQIIGAMTINRILKLDV
jgi:tight adherence protein B